jgi:hypothetical protein
MPNSDYRTSALEVRVLQVNANHARGSLTIGTIAAIIFAFTLAWYPTINRLRFAFDCKRIGNDRAECILTRDVLFFKTHETVRFTPSTATAYVQSSEPIPEECSNTAILGRFPATLDEARTAADDLNDFFTTPTTQNVHMEYGPGFDAVPVIAWAVVALLLAASLVVRRYHRVILKWDPVERYLTVERRQWPFPAKIDHIPNELLIAARTSGEQMLDTELVFASGKKVSLFGRTAANPKVHEQAVAGITRFLAEQAERAP